MTGGFGQMGGMSGVPGGPGQMPSMGGAPPQGQPMGDPNLGGLAVMAGPQGAPAMGHPMGMGQVAQQNQGQGPPRPPPSNPLTAWIPSFPEMLSKANALARAVPWFIWLTIGVGVVLLFKSDNWMSKVKRWIGGAFGSAVRKVKSRA